MHVAAPACREIRNENGSHNPYEAMEIDDFLDGAAVMTHWLMTELTR